jgi:hypothetical protein
LKAEEKPRPRCYYLTGENYTRIEDYSLLGCNTMQFGREDSSTVKTEDG